MDDKINLAEKFAQLPDAYQPAIVGYMNDYKLVVVKTQGEFVWHKHDETDELFLIGQGRLTIQFRDRDVVLEPGELFVVPRGVEHCPKADEETHVLLIEPRETRQHRRRGRRADGAADRDLSAMEYAYDNALPEQLRRLRTLEELFDAGSIRVLEARGLQPSWRCLEVGAGGGSIARWLAERSASVLATDLDTTHVRAVAGSNLEVREHDLLRDELPDAAFDLIHLRLVLAWLADRPAALARLLAALRPGGWLVAEELDFNAAIADPHMEAARPGAVREDCVRARTTTVLGLAERVRRRSTGGACAGDLAEAGFALASPEEVDEALRCSTSAVQLGVAAADGGLGALSCSVTGSSPPR